MGSHVCFFYGKSTPPHFTPHIPKLTNPGTLMAPQILYRVIYGRVDPEPWQKELLTFQPAILHGFKRHRVRNHSYPAIIAESGTTASDSVSTAQDVNANANASANANAASVLGTLVSGLTDGDIYRLDLFEGDPYSKVEVSVRTLRRDGNESGQGSLSDVLDGVVGSVDVQGGKEVVAVTYVWIAGEELLEGKEWDLETFKREKMAKWIADESMW
ncbi:hypothetical protein N7533_011202 [Penicillium manginii]|uniref:uncharacterized protein n=1 Tax=Penicillium manginii TaxID=203109 RepID=UPI00254864FD|nr:uncharacterized protein N7533_011202 [Penicillium manginii]KAJ5741793.1 hypothetical protein N7533_011202 [Penicillium manginii]